MMQYESPEYKKLHAVCENSSLQYNTVPALDTSFQRAIPETIRSNFNYPVMMSDNLFVRFPISASNLMIDALSIALHVQARLFNADGSALTTFQLAAVIPGLLSNMIAKVEIFANGKVVVVYDNYPYIAYPQQLLHLESHYVKETLG